MRGRVILRYLTGSPVLASTLGGVATTAIITTLFFLWWLTEPGSGLFLGFIIVYPAIVLAAISGFQDTWTHFYEGWPLIYFANLTLGVIVGACFGLIIKILMHAVKHLSSSINEV